MHMDFKVPHCTVENVTIGIVLSKIASSDNIYFFENHTTLHDRADKCILPIIHLAILDLE